MQTYKNALDNIKASNNFKNETAALLIGSQKKPKRRLMWKLSAIAAALAIVIGLSFILRTPLNHNGNDFLLTAGAATATADEVSSESYTAIGKIRPDYSAFTQTNQHIGPNAVVCVAEFDTQIEGENIVKISYSIDGGAFWISEAAKGISAEADNTDIIEQYALDSEKIYGNTKFNFCNSYSVPYSNQPKSSYRLDEGVHRYFDCPVLIFAGIEEESFLTLPEDVQEFFYSFTDDNVDYEEVGKLNNQELKAIYDGFYNSIFGGVRVRVRVDRTDGSSEERTLSFKSDFKSYGEELCLTAKLDDKPSSFTLSPNPDSLKNAINDKNYVNIGEFYDNRISEKDGKFNISVDFAFSVGCLGDNIEKISFNVKNAAFSIEDGYQGISETKLTRADAPEGYKAFDSYTVKYKYQPSFDKANRDGTYPILLTVNASYDKNNLPDYVEDIYHKLTSERAKAYQRVCEDLFRGVKLTAKATLTSGEVKTVSVNLRGTCIVQNSSISTLDDSIVIVRAEGKTI